MRRVQLPLRQQITALGTISALLATLAVAVLVVFNENRASKAVSDEVIGIMQDRLARSAEKTYSICNLSEEFVQQSVDTSLSLGDAAIKLAGGVQNTGRSITWTATNQETKVKTQITAPQWSLKGTPLTPDRSFDHAIPVIDDIAKQTNETVTVFQRVNAAGDMLRVATTVPDLDGLRASGTYIPWDDKKGVVKTVMSGQIYRGRAYVVNAWYTTAYEPLHDGNGNVI